MSDKKYTIPAFIKAKRPKGRGQDKFHVLYTDGFQDKDQLAGYYPNEKQIIIKRSDKEHEHLSSLIHEWCHLLGNSDENLAFSEERVLKLEAQFMFLLKQLGVLD